MKPGREQTEGSDLPPGRELDALIAEKVMGLVLEQKCTQCDGTGYVDQDRCHICHYSLGHPGVKKIFPKEYSTDIAAAWEVVEKILSTGIDFTLEAGPNKTTKERYYGVSINDVDPQYSEISAPHAICLAALKAVGVKLEP